MKSSKYDSIIRLLKLSPKSFIKNGIIMDVKFELNSDNGWAVVGNDWSNALRGLVFPITYEDLIKDGWKPL